MAQLDHGMKFEPSKLCGGQLEQKHQSSFKVGVNEVSI